MTNEERKAVDREAYELDVAQAQKAYDARPSSMNFEDLYAAKDALRRHWPRAAKPAQTETRHKWPKL